MLAWRFATWSADANARELKRFQAESKVTAAQANERVEQLRIDQGPRAQKLNIEWLGGNGGLPSVLQANAPGKALIRYLPNDPEAKAFARELWVEIQTSGWTVVSDIERIPSDVSAKEESEIQRAVVEKLPVFSLVQIDGGSPLLVATNGGRNWNEPPIVPAKALIIGLLKCRFSVGGAGNNNPLVPPDVVLLVVGQKQ